MARTVEAGITLPDPTERDITGKLLAAVHDLSMSVSGILDVNISGSGNLTLTSEQCRARLVRLTGITTGARTIFVPTAECMRALCFKHAAAGGHTHTLKVVNDAGPGVQLSPGAVRDVIHDSQRMYPGSNEFAATTLNNGLVAAFKLNETSAGTSAVQRNDSCGANHLTDNNTVASAAGLVGNCANFVAANSEYLSVADNAAMSTGDIDFQFTVLVNLTTLTSPWDIIAKFGASGQEEYLLNFDNGASRFQWIVTSNGQASGRTTVVANTFGAPVAGTWYLISVYHDAAANQIGISVNNGAFNTAAHAAGVFDSTTAFQLGARASGPIYLNGKMQGVHFWKRRLTTAELTEVYNSGNGLLYPF